MKNGSRPDGGPATFDELLAHYRKMAEIHDAKGRELREDADRTEPEHRRRTLIGRAHDRLSMASAYAWAAEELEKVMELVSADA